MRTSANEPCDSHRQSGRIPKRTTWPLPNGASTTAALAREPFTPAELKAMDDKLTESVKRGYAMWYGARADMSSNEA